MATVSLMWAQGSQVRTAALTADRATIGRGRECDVVLTDPTVSRRHAALLRTGGRYRLENLSGTNVTRLNNQPVREPAELSDGDRLTLGDVSLVFHDLRSKHRISGPICSHCDRENEASATFCWYCGTSLVNALSGARRRVRLGFRAVAADDSSHDVYVGQALELNAAGPPAVRTVEELQRGLAAIEAGDDGPMLRVPQGMTDVIRNGDAAVTASAVNDGDEVTYHSTRLLLLVPGPA